MASEVQIRRVPATPEPSEQQSSVVGGAWTRGGPGQGGGASALGGGVSRLMARAAKQAAPKPNQAEVANMKIELDNKDMLVNKVVGS